MRVLHLVESLERGGLERVVVNLARAQQERGHEVAVSCLFRLGALAAELDATGIRVTCCEKGSGLDFAAARAIRRELVRSRAQVLHTHNAMANYYGALAALGLTTRIVNTRHGMGCVERPDLKERLYRGSMLCTAAVALVCEQAKERFVASGSVPERLGVVLTNGIGLDRIAATSEDSRQRARAMLGIEPGACVVGTVGRLNWAKDHGLLVDAFAALHSRHPASRLVIVGGGELRSALEQQVSRLALDGAVRLTGDRDDVPALLPAFDLFAMPSVTEGYSIALLEAAAAALPAVVSDVGGNREIVQHGTTGLVVTLREPTSFADAFETLVTQPELRARMGRRARAWVEQHGSLSAMERAYHALYERVIAGELARSALA